MNDNFQQVMQMAFRDELQKLASEGALPFALFEKAAAAEVDFEAMAKEALPSMQSMGQSLSKGFAGARSAVNSAAAAVPGIGKTLATPMSGIAHNMQHSPNSFVQGMGNVLHHQTGSTTKGMLAMANPLGSAAEMVAGGVGNAASKGLSTAGGAMQRAATAPAIQGLGAADTAMARGMTPRGQLMNAAQNVGGRVQSMFSPGGGGHTALTKVMPRAAELAGGVAGGALLHVPSLAGSLGGAGMSAAGAIAPGMAEAAHHALGHFAGGAADLVHHGAADVLGTMKQGPLMRGASAVAGRMGNAITRNLQATPKMASAHSNMSYLKAFGHGVSEELPTAAGAALGLGAAKMYELKTGKKINPIAASGIGYGIGGIADAALRGH